MLAINPKIKQKAEDIRKKIFGSEVRESLASGIEAISEDVEATIGRQDYVEEQFQNVIDETTDKDVINGPEVIAARNGEANLKTRLDKEKQEVTAQLQQTEQELSSQLADNMAQPSYDSIYSLAKVKDLNVVGFGDSITQGYALPNVSGLDGELQYYGVKSFVNTFYLDLLKKTANFLGGKTSNLIITGTTGSIIQIGVSSPAYLFYYLDDCVMVRTAYNQVSDRVITLNNYYGKEITIWGIKNNLAEASKCDVFIDDVKVGEIDQKSTTMNAAGYLNPTTFTTIEGYHKVELKNFTNSGVATSGNCNFYFCGISNRSHRLYNEAYGAKGTKWAIENMSRVLTKSPDVVLLGFGANDCGLPINDPQHAEPPVFYSNYAEIIKQIQDAYPLCKFSIMTSAPDSNAGAADWVSDYLPMVYKLAKIKNARIVDSWNTLNAISTATWRIDNIHPNEYGHSVIKDLLIKAWCPELLIVDDNVLSIPKLSMLPTPSVVYRSKIYTVEGGVGVADIAYVCQKNASDVYAWTQLI